LNLAKGFHENQKSEAERKRFFDVSGDSVIESDAALDTSQALGYCKKENLQSSGNV
jgi:hypothetical protein